MLNDHFTSKYLDSVTYRCFQDAGTDALFPLAILGRRYNGESTQLEPESSEYERVASSSTRSAFFNTTQHPFQLRR